jgi:hypothetical protein
LILDSTLGHPTRRARGAVLFEVICPLGNGSRLSERGRNDPFDHSAGIKAPLPLRKSAGMIV